MPRKFNVVLATFAALMLAPCPAIASEWWYVNSGANRVVFVDAQSIERKKDIVTYWTMHVIRPGEPEVMTKSHMRADCGKRRLSQLQLVRYDEKGQAIGDSKVHAEPMQAVPPDTLGDAEFRFACGDEGHRVTNDLFPLAVDEVAFAEALIARGNHPDDAHALHDEMSGKRTHAAAPTSPERPTTEKADSARQDITASPIEDTQAEPDEDIAETKRLTESCDTGLIPSCAQLGKRLANGEGVEKDEVRAAILYDKACTGGDADSCTLLGIAYGQGSGVSRSAERAYAYFAQACDKGGPGDCGNLGLALVKGDGVAKDIKRAFGYFVAACDSGNAASCSSLGASYSLGVGVKVDQRRAMRLFKKACDGDDAGGCYNLGVLYDQGLGVKKDPARAVSLYEGACDQDDGSACGNLGTLVQNGNGTTKDAVRAAELFRKGCDLEDADGCLNLGRAYQAGSGVERDVEQAAAFFRRSLAIEPDKTDALRALGALKRD